MDYTGGTATMLQQSAKVMQDLRNLESMGQEMKSLLDGGQNFPLSAILQRMQQLTQAQQAVYRNAKTWQDQMDANQQVYGSQVQQAVGASNTAAGPTGVGQATNQILATLSAQLTEQTRMLSAMQTQQMQQQQLDKAREAAKLKAFNSGWPSNTTGATNWFGGSSAPSSTIPTY